MNTRILSIFTFLTINLYSQSITKFYDGVIFCGVENKIKLHEGELKHPLLLSEDASVRQEKNGMFLVEVISYKSVGRIIQIDLYDSLLTEVKKISTYNYLVKKVPDPEFALAGIVIKDTISRSMLLKMKKLDIILNDTDFVKKFDVGFELKSFDMEIDGKQFHSNSGELTSKMIYYLSHSSGNYIRILNEKVVITGPAADGVARRISANNSFVVIK